MSQAFPFSSPVSMAFSSPLSTSQSLYSKYSSSQTYYYSNVITQITKQRRTTINITYEDTEFLCDSQEYLKRFYQQHQYQGKMFTFKEYYFYHEDCPRIFIQKIQDIYSKWQDRRRDIVYKKLKVLYNQSFSSSKSSTQRQQENKSASGITHFLLQISDYNPFSKKYYLRVQAKRQKQQQQREKKKVSLKNSKNSISYLNHQLSVMLNDMSQLSNITNIQDTQQSPRLSTLYHPKKLKINYSSQYSTNNNSQSNSNIQNGKFNFKKSKQYSNDKETNILQQYNSKITLKGKNQKINFPTKVSPKYSQKQLTEQLNRRNSVFQLSTFNSNFTSNKKSQLIFDPNGLHKKEGLKLRTDNKPPSRQSKLTFESKTLKRYDSQKKVLTKSHGNNKMPDIKYKNQISQQKLGLQALNKKSSIHILSTQQKPLSRNNSHKISLSKQVPYTNQFCDNQLQTKQDVRFRSHKSQYSSLQKPLLSKGTNSPGKGMNSPAKPMFKIVDTHKTKLMTKQKIQIQIPRKGHQLKLQ